MSPTTRDAKKYAKARRRRYRTVHERLARDRRQAQHAAEALQQALNDLGLPEDLVAEIEGRLHSQHKLLGKIVGVMCPPLSWSKSTRKRPAWSTLGPISPRDGPKEAGHGSERRCSLEASCNGETR
jgi:hypothetical protein